jgi:hypothetical protein
MAKAYKSGLLLVIVAGLALAAVFWARPRASDRNVKGVSGAEQPSVQFERLEGRWVRPDGGYVLLIEDVKPDGALKASYFNPRQINVHAAKWSAEDGRPHLFIELRDVNYPGSKYDLIYVSEHDVLGGTYFQAVYKQTFEVYFVRTGENSKE